MEFLLQREGTPARIGGFLFSLSVVGFKKALASLIPV